MRVSHSDRLRTGEPLNRYERATFYTYSDVGYTDYPTSTQRVMGRGTRYTTVDQSVIGKTLGGPVLPSKF